jgi:ribosomal protein S18 acetylase RimI-like enzyme
VLNLDAVRALEKEVVAHDGGRLKLELGLLESGEVQTPVRWDGDRVIGFAGRYDFAGLEIAGMVAPDVRRKGIGTELLAELVAAGEQALLVTPTATPAGRAFAAARDATLDHSEHYLVLAGTPTGQPRPDISIRPAGPDDLETVRDLLRSAFDWEPPTDILDRAGDRTQVIEQHGTPVGTLRVNRHEDWAGVYGFAVAPSRQGQGIGRDALTRTCQVLRADGAVQVTLEVETRNDSALHLYTSIGFEKVAGEDYWKVSG